MKGQTQTMPATRMIALWGLRVALMVLMLVPASLIVETVVAGGPVAAEAATVRKIVVDGNRRVEPETVRSYLQFSTGDTYDEFLVDQSLKALFETGLFSDVRIDRNGSTVVVTVVENPIVNRVAFEGNYEVDDKALAAEVQLKSRSVYTRSRVQAAVQRILDVYSRQGRFTAVVEPKIIELPQNRVDLVFEITEGPDTKVKSINFIGNRAFSDSQLSDIITTSENNWLSFLKPTDIYDPDRLNLDQELLRQFYLKNGFADARVISATADLDRSGQGFFITFTLEEGELYTFGDVRIESNLESVDANGLSGLVLTYSGEIYDAAAIEKTVERLTLQVAEQGYAFARVRPRADRDPINRTIGISYVIEQGPRVYIERINIVGNIRTRDYVIRREFRIAEGDAYNRLLVSRARTRLQGLGYFKKVDVVREPGSASDRIVLTVKVIEESTGELSLGGGYSTNEGIIGDVSLTERNFMGKGQFVRLRIAGSLERLQVDLGFTEPRFLDRNLSAGVDVFHKEVDFSDESSARSRKSGGGVRLGFPVAENTWFSTRYSFVRDEVFDVEPDASLAVQQAIGVNYVSSVGYSVNYDTRNHKAKPTRGVYFVLSQDLAGVGGDVNYVRTLAEGRGYYPITDKITLVGRVIGGLIEGWGGQSVRLSDAFFKGGETIRGFDRAGIGPRAANGDALGGKVFYAATAEIRFPIPLLPEELGLGGAIFADAGSLFDFDSATAVGTVVQDANSIRSAVGASLLWDSPVGPLRADFSYVLSAEDFDVEEAFRFGATTRF